MAVFQHDIGLQPSLLVTALSGIGLRVELAFSSELGSVPPPLFSENIYDSYYFILRCLMKFTGSITWVRSLLCGKISNYKFDNFNRYRLFKFSVSHTNLDKL